MKFESAHTLWLAAEQCAAILSQAQMEIKGDISKDERQKSAKYLGKALAALYEHIEEPLQKEHPNLKAHYLGGQNKVDREMLDEVAEFCSKKTRESVFNNS